MQVDVTPEEKAQLVKALIICAETQIGLTLDWEVLDGFMAKLDK